MIRRLARTTLLSIIFASAVGCGSCGTAGPGESCDPSDSEACEDGFACLADENGDNLCLTPIGASCDPDEDNYCAGEASCIADAEGDGSSCYVDSGGSCEPGEEECAPGLVCAEKTDGDNSCFNQVVLRGNVFDSQTEDALGGARIIALDEESTAVTDVSVSAEDGTYELSLPVVRDAEGRPTDEIFTLRSSAQDYQTFPSGIRTALPIDASTATDDDGAWVIQNALTDIALIALPSSQQGRPSISGNILSEDRRDGVLVVAEIGDEAFTGVSDLGGEYVIFNVPAGSATVRGYAAGVQLEPEEVTVADEPLVDVDLDDSGEETTDVSGSVQIVNAPGGSVTSVVLVVRSTFDAQFGRGEVPSGLRAPKSGPPSIEGSWEIADVPAGDYVILAAFENDDLVRDPDTTIGGTETIEITVAPGEPLAISEGFKVTEALDVITPGADRPEAVTSAPTLTWEDDSSEDYYVVQVFNAFGELVWEDATVPGVSGSDDVTVEYGGPLEAGMYYQFRATSWKESGGSKPAAPISTTEDLKGVFFRE